MRIMRTLFVVGILTATLYAVSIDTFMKKGASNYHLKHVSMIAMITHLDCSFKGKYREGQESCRVTTRVKRRYASDQLIYMIFDISHRDDLIKMKEERGYNHFGCTYDDRRRLMTDCYEKFF